MPPRAANPSGPFTILHVAEKPSIARTIAGFLSGGSGVNQVSLSLSFLLYIRRYSYYLPFPRIPLFLPPLFLRYTYLPLFEYQQTTLVIQ